jgi:hypothetical protein
LYNCVIDSDRNASAIIASKPQNRVTFLPLNKMRPNIIDEQRIEAAKEQVREA